MALIKCKECGKEISDTADKCIHCGIPPHEDEIKKEITAGLHISKKLAVILIVILSIILICAFVFGYFIPAHTYHRYENGQYIEEFRLFK